MRTNWEQCKNTPQPGFQTLALHVTLDKHGHLRMNRTTLEKLGEPNALKVFFDPTNSRFGVKPCHESSSHAFKLCKAGRYGARRISVLPALIERRIDIRETVQFMDPEFDEDGMLVLDLRSAKVTNRVSNHWSRRKGLPKDV